MNLIETFKGLPAENRSETLKSFVEQVKNLKNCSNLVLAKILYEIEQDGYYNEWTYVEDGSEKTYQSINDFARVAFDYSKSTTQSFLRIHQKFSVDLQVEDDVLTRLPWGNLRIVCPHVTNENLQYVLKLCEGKQKDVKAWASQFSETKEQVPRYSFTVDESQAEIIDTAFDVAKMNREEECGVPCETEGQIWEFMCSQYLMAGTKPLKLQDYITLLESRFDVRLGLVEEDAPIPKSPATELPNKSPTTKASEEPFKTETEKFTELGLSLADEDYEEIPDVLTEADFR